MTRESQDYRLVCVSNDTMGELENETVALTKYIRDTYAPRFPELEALIQNPNDYVRTVYRIGNENDITAVDLSGILPSATVMVVTVTATTTSGKPLAPEVLAKVRWTPPWPPCATCLCLTSHVVQVMEACRMVLDIEDTRTRILEFVETRMNILAPNVRPDPLAALHAPRQDNHAQGLGCQRCILSCTATNNAARLENLTKNSLHRHAPRQPNTALFPHSIATLPRGRHVLYCTAGAKTLFQHMKTLARQLLVFPLAHELSRVRAENDWSCFLLLSCQSLSTDSFPVLSCQSLLGQRWPPS